MQEEAAWDALELMNRQQYLAGFNKKAFELPAQRVYICFDHNNKVHMHGIENQVRL
jgi:hypothetical protein